MTAVTSVVTPGRDGRWQEDPGTGIYVHIPFCRHRCHYCDFNTYEGMDHLHSSYVAALLREIDAIAVSGTITSVFFGGGTPTLLPSDLLARVLERVQGVGEIASDAEITIEANPETLDATYSSRLVEAGFNRVSIGVQSAVDGVLARLGRTHSAAAALDAIAAARRGGFGDVNADLIFGSPWETGDDWARSLDAVIAAEPDHISAYALTVEEGTPLHTLVATGRVRGVDPDVQAERYEIAGRALQAAGYLRYEVSNWAKPGRASRHNVLYWSGGNYTGVGAGAHSHLDGRRWWNLRLPREYIASLERGDRVVEGEERLSAGARAGEALMLGLRLAEGIAVDGYAERFGRRALESRNGTLSSLQSQGLVEQAGGRLRLTTRGTLLANDVLCRLL